MLHRIASLTAALALCCFVGAAVAADKTAADKTSDTTSNSKVTGTVEKASADSLTITDKDGKEHKLMVAKDATVTCDGKECKAADLKAGATVTVSTKKDGDNMWATKIEAKSGTPKDNK